MHIIDAVWEKRNLGVTAQEVTVDSNDSVNEIKEELGKLTAEYQVVKVPAGDIDRMWAVEDSGFKYIETSINVVHDFKNLELSPMLKRIDSSISYEPMDELDIKQMCDEIRKGLFYTDRIILDKHFTSEQAANRYVGWLMDEKERGTEFFKYVYKGQAVGFFSFKETSPGVYYPFLAGIYTDYQKYPFGMVYLYKPLVEAMKRGGTMVSTYISTNNSNAVRMHTEFGFKIREITNVYVKHM